MTHLALPRQHRNRTKRFACAGGRPYINSMIVIRVLVLAAIVVVGALVGQAVGCERSAEDARAYAAEHAAGAELTVIDGREANRFRVLLNSTDPVDTSTGEVFHVERRADEVRIYWMKPLAYVQMHGDGCSLMAHTFKDHVAQWVLHRMHPDDWPMPPEYRGKDT